MNDHYRDILTALSKGEITVDEAELAMRAEPVKDIGYAKLDLHRRIRQGAGEVVYGSGKTPDQIAGIVEALTASGQERVLITRLDPDKYEAFINDPRMASVSSFHYDELSRTAIIGEKPSPDGEGFILVATGGTSDIPVAEEAAVTAEFLGNEVIRLFDVGVAGIHRLLPHTEEIMKANAIIAVAGMEGALASVIGGLADCPVIAVPTSVGYGASFGGISALLSMLNSCASGVSVVNIDNGFGAGFLASRINHPKRKEH